MAAPGSNIAHTAIDHDWAKANAAWITVTKQSTNMQLLKQIFDELFKYKNTESLRHRGDNKNSYSTDMGLLVLHRSIIEDVDDEGNQTFERVYHCRVVRFSGSGEIMSFKERELMSMAEYHEAQLNEEKSRNEMRQEMKRTEAEIFNAYGVNKECVVTLKNDEPGVEYHVTGFRGGGEANTYELSLRSIGGLELDRKNIYIKSPDEIESVK
jgi:hypothetical protein